MYQLEIGPKINFVLSTNEPIPAKKTNLKYENCCAVFIRAKWRHVSPVLDKEFDVDGVNLGKVCIVWGSIYSFTTTREDEAGKTNLLAWSLCKYISFSAATRKYEKKNLFWDWISYHLLEIIQRPRLETARHKKTSTTSFSKHMRLGRDIGFGICEAPKHVPLRLGVFLAETIEVFISRFIFIFSKWRSWTYEDLMTSDWETLLRNRTRNFRCFVSRQPTENYW